MTALTLHFPLEHDWSKDRSKCAAPKSAPIAFSL
jgi:hypothetical protein